MEIKSELLTPVLKKKISRLAELGQAHIFEFRDRLTISEQSEFLRQIAGFDLDLLEKQIQMVLNGTVDHPLPRLLEPARVTTISEWQSQKDHYFPIGETALRRGELAIVTVAGGQGTRLGYEAPKGTFSVTPLREKPLFRVFAEKILYLNRRYGVQLPWYIMTSPINDQPTREFFAAHNYFGLAPESVHFFIQSTIPALDNEARLILDRANHIFENPNGHGGTIKALWDQGCLHKMKAGGVRYVFYFQVDNALVRLCDPLFLGYHIERKSEMSSKVVRKRDAGEKVGIICQVNHKTGVVEYSDLDPQLARLTDDSGQLVYWAGSIAIHLVNLDFLLAENENGFKLPWHLAHKIIPVYQPDGSVFIPEKPNGIKFESFIFDALLDARQTFTMEVDRADEFSPLKNKDGSDSIDSVIEDQYRLARRWLVQAGLAGAGDAENIYAEISPLTMACPEDLNGLDPARITIDEDEWYIE